MGEKAIIALKVVSGPDTGRIFPVSETCFGGRQDSCGVQLTDPSLALMHVRFTVRGDEVTVTDLTPDPDVRVNDRVVKSRKLQAGDRLSIGGTVLEVVAGAAPAGAADAEPGPSVTVVGTSTVPVEPIAEAIESAARARAPQPPAPAPAAGPAAGSPRREIRIPRLAPDAPTEVPVPAPASRRGLWITVSVLILLAIAGFAGFTISGRNQVQAKLRQASRYAETHPDDLDGIVKRYRDVQTIARDRSAGVAAFLEGEITRLEKQKMERDEAFRKLLATLDQQADAFRDQDRYEEAVGVYETVPDLGYRKLVLDIRRDHIETIRREGTEFRKRQDQEAQQKRAAEQKQQEEGARTRLAESVTQSAEAVVDSRPEVALELLSGLRSDRVYQAITSRVERALDDVRMLAAVDQTVRNAQAAGRSDFEPDLAAATPFVRTVFALRSGDVWKAQEAIRGLDGHLLHDALLARAQIPDDEARQEQDAIRALAAAWGRVTGATVRRVPRPEECVATLAEAVKQRKPEELQEAIRALQDVAAVHAGTRLVRRYEPVFKAVGALRTQDPARGASGRDFGDGRILQRDGTTWFVELREVPASPETYRLGLYREDTAYYHIETRQPVLSRGAIYAVVPFKPLADKQVSFTFEPRPDGPQPTTNDCVVVARDVKEGPRVLSGREAGKSVTLYRNSFDEGIDGQWQGPFRRQVDKGRLCVDTLEWHPVSKDGIQEADLALRVDAGKEPARVTVDLFKGPDQAFVLALGPVSFRWGGREDLQGIYVFGRRAQPALFPKSVADKAQKVVVERDAESARIDVDGVQAACLIGNRAGAAVLEGVGFSGEGAWQLDNVKVERVTSVGNARIEAVSRDGGEVLVAPGQEPEWTSLKQDLPVYFFRVQAATGGVQQVGSGKVAGAYESRVLCKLDPGTQVVPGLRVSTVREFQPGEGARGNREAARPDRLVEGELALGTVSNVQGDVIHIRLDSARGVPAKGQLWVAEDVIRNPHSGEPLAATPVRGAPCDFRQDGGEVVCLLPAALKGGVSPQGAVILGRGMLTDGKRVDLAGRIREYVPSGVARKQTYWSAMIGGWEESKDGLACKRGTQASLEARDVFAGNVQWDVEAVIENEPEPKQEGDEERNRWKELPEIVLQVVFPGLHAAVSFDLGTAAGGGFVAGGYALQNVGGTLRLRPSQFPKGFSLRKDGEWPTRQPALAAGERYRIRVRKAGAALACYVNGKRIARVSAPGTEELDAFLLVAAPQGGVRVGRVKARELASSTTIPDVEPVLGEFGYVLAVSGSAAFVDSDAQPGTGANRKVSVLAVGNIVRGAESMTVMTRRVGQGTVSDAGPLVTRLLVSEGADEVKAGMKVLPGVVAPDLVLTSGRIQDLKEGL